MNIDHRRRLGLRGDLRLFHARPGRPKPDDVTNLIEIRRAITECERCPRLRDYCRRIAREKRRAYLLDTYWGRPVPGFGDPDARLLIVGLAPAAHGGNRTGRIFTGDRSGDFLFAALHRAGIASQKESIKRGDGMKVQDTYILAAVRCAPPDNHPSPAETRRCAPFLDRELELLANKRVVLALGNIAWNAWLDHIARRGLRIKPKPEFGHGAHVPAANGLPHLVGSFHVSAQNTLTGKLTEPMFDKVLAQALRLARE